MEADNLIKKLNMISHPEGGHYVENFKNENVSQIYYLLKRNEKSHWHRLTKNEILHFYSGDPLEVFTSNDGVNYEVFSFQETAYSYLGQRILLLKHCWFF